MLRLLPVPLPPVHGETIGSYLNRLADANRLPVRYLAGLIGVHSHHRRDDHRADRWTPQALHALSILTGRPRPDWPARCRPWPSTPASLRSEHIQVTEPTGLSADRHATTAWPARASTAWSSARPQPTRPSALGTSAGSWATSNTVSTTSRTSDGPTEDTAASHPTATAPPP